MMVRTVGCLDVETIVAFVEARMAPDDVEQMEAHVSGCASCRERLSLAIAASPMSAISPTSKRTGGAARPPKPAPERSALGRGTAIGRYTVLELLGRGGMGEVYAAYDPELDRKIALKLLHAREKASDERSRSRLLREAKAIAKLRTRTWWWFTTRAPWTTACSWRWSTSTGRRWPPGWPSARARAARSSPSSPPRPAGWRRRTRRGSFIAISSPRT